MVKAKLKCLRNKPTHDDIIEAKEVYIQQSFGRYKGKKGCVFKARQYRLSYPKDNEERHKLSDMTTSYFVKVVQK